MVRDLDLEVHQNPERDPRCDFEKIGDGHVKTTLRPVETNGSIDTEVHQSAGILDVIGLGMALTMSLGLAGTWKALGQKPAGYLRSE